MTNKTVSLFEKVVRMLFALGMGLANMAITRPVLAAQNMPESAQSISGATLEDSAANQTPVNEARQAPSSADSPQFANAINATGDWLVTNFASGKIERLNSAGVWQGTFSAVVPNPVGITIGKDGNVYVYS